MERYSLGSKVSADSLESWVFPGMELRQVQSLLLTCGLASNDVQRAESPDLAAEIGGTTVVKPDEALVFALAPGVRARLGHELGQNDHNLYMQFPFCFGANTLNAWFAHSEVDSQFVADVERLLYRRGMADCFSDLGIMPKRLPGASSRVQLVRTLSRQAGVLPRLFPGKSALSHLRSNQ